MQMKFILLAAIIPLSAVGCNNWEAQKQSSHWENGKPGAAGWVARGGRKSQDQITVIGGVTIAATTDADYTQTAYNAISHMLATARPSQGNEDMAAHATFDSTRPVMYSTTVNLNDYDKTTNFGRLMAEALATALTQHWENEVINMNLRQGSVPIIPRQGEFMLSRDMNELATGFNVGAVLLSTYTIAIDKVYVNVELVNVHHNSQVAAVMFDIPLGPRTAALLMDIEYASGLDSYLKGNQ
jgi:TolB-like protein